MQDLFSETFRASSTKPAGPIQRNIQGLISENIQGLFSMLLFISSCRGIFNVCVDLRVPLSMSEHTRRLIHYPRIIGCVSPISIHMSFHITFHFNVLIQLYISFVCECECV
ncbi:hypothetical protein BsWGS_00170 [Bradybaena similaris]